MDNISRERLLSGRSSGRTVRPELTPKDYLNWLKYTGMTHGTLPGYLGYAGGGAIDQGIAAAAAIDGRPYIYGGVGPNGYDCSGAQSYVYAAFTGKPTSTRYFTTESDFEALGFKQGNMPGAYNIGVSRGGGGKLSHMGATLPNGVNFEAGGANNGVAYGDGARGAGDFPLQWYLPLAGGDPESGATSAGGGSSPFAGGSAIAAVTGGAPTTSDTTSSSSSGGGGGGGESFDLPSSLSGFGAFTGDKLGELLKSAGSAVDGQVASALDVFGVPDSPGWLKGISALIGGIKIGGGDGSADPLSANPSGTGTPPPDDPGNMHGGRAGQQPGPVYNITARDTEDAFIKAQRVEREKAAAKLSRF